MNKAKVLRVPSLLLLVFLIVLLAGCSVSQPQQGGEKQKTLTINLGNDIPDLNSTTTTDEVSTNVLNNVMEGLYRLDESEEPQPAMAKSVEISDNKLTYTFKLRDGIEWSNGAPVTSQDFKYAWLRAMDPNTAGQYASILSDYIAGGTEFNAGEVGPEFVGVETPDDKTLAVKLKNPTPFFLSLTAFQTYLPLNQEFVEQQGDKYAQSADALLYNGPYTLSEFSPSEGATFVKNENYWDKGNVDIEQVKAKTVKETDTALGLYQSGDLDVVNLRSEYVDQYKDSTEFATQPNFNIIYIEMNQENPVLQNKNIRRAIQMGTNRQALANTRLNNGSEPAVGYVPIGMAGSEGQTFRQAAGTAMPEFDPERARELYERGVEELGGELTLKLLTDEASESRYVAAFLQSQLEENLGAKAEINQQPLDRRLDLTKNGDYQLAVVGWKADYNDPINFLDLFRSDSEFNDPRFQNKRYDELISGAKTEADPKERINMLIEAEKILLDEAAIAPLYQQGQARLVKPYVEHYKEHPYGAGIELKLLSIEKY